MSLHATEVVPVCPAGATIALPSGELPAELWTAYAMIVLLEPEPKLHAQWTERLSAGFEALERQRRELREARRRRILEQSAQAARVGARPRDPETVAGIDAKLTELAAAMSAVPTPVKNNRRAVKAGQAKVRKVERELDDLRAAELAQQQLYGVAAEPIIRARMRGEEVTAFEAETADFARDEHGAVIRHKRGSNRGLAVLVYDRGLRARRLTGIEHALGEGYLANGGNRADRLFRTGVSYREAYEIAEGQTSSGGEGGGGFGPKAPQPRLVEAGQALADMRKGLNPRQRRVLDLVCGQDMRLREAATQMGAGFPATVRALCGGLAAAADSMAAARERRADSGEGALGEKVRAATVMLAGMRS